MATSVLGLKTFAASEPVDYNEVNDNYVKIDNGVKTAMQGRAAQNLLDNSNFADLIAQAGLNGSHGGTAYIADRWIGSADITPTAKTDGILLATTNHYAFIQQRVRVTRGKTYTLALSTTGGTTMQRIAVFNIGLTEIFASVEGSNGVIIATFDAAYDDMAMLFYPGYADGGGSAVFKWAALYEGAYTADTLPDYVPKGYAAELAECQRYFQASDNPFFVGSVSTGINYNGILFFTPMRIVPTITVSSQNGFDVVVVSGTRNGFIARNDNSNTAQIIWNANADL